MWVRTILLLMLSTLASATALLWPQTALATDLEVMAVATGYSHTCAVTADGGVKCWGSNDRGQLGTGSTDNDPHPFPENVVGLSSGVTALGAGAEHTCALTTGGGVKCWGFNFLGQLGDGSEETRPSPVDVSGLTSSVNSISVGRRHTCAVVGSALKCWGENLGSQLGAPTAETCGGISCSTTPLDVSDLDGFALAVTTGGSFTCALRLSPSPEFFTGFQCWGRNTNGQLGDGQACGTTCAAPVDVCSDAACTARLGGAAIEAGRHHACATVNGRAKCWGNNGTGQLGDAQSCATSECATPVDVCANVICASSLSVAALAGGELHTCAVTPSGGLKCWGGNNVGQLGRGNLTPQAVPVDVPGLTSGVAAIDLGPSHTCAVTTAGGLKCWGSNGDGRLGDGTTMQRTSPVDVVGLGPDADRDGCTNDQEKGNDQALGGRRDPENFWDFFDIPNADNQRDRAISASDIARVVGRFGSSGSNDIDPLSAPDPAPAYHTAFDRTPAGDAPNGRAQGPNGSVSAQDIALIVLQFGHTCA